MEFNFISSAQLLLGLVAVAIELYKQRCVRHMRRRQNELMNALPEPQRATSFRVGIADHHHVHWFWRLLPYQALGVLTLDEGTIRLRGERLNGQVLDWQTPHTRDIAQVIQPSSLRPEYWLELGQQPQSVYCTASPVDGGIWRTHLRDQRDQAQQVSQIYQHLNQTRPLPESLLRLMGNDLQLPTFALEKNPGSLRMLLLLAGLIAYMLIDWITNPVMVLDAGQWPWLAWPLMLLGIFVYRYLHRHAVPASESAVLSVLVALAIGAAWIPMSWRLGEWLSPGYQPVAYEYLADYALHSQNDEAPPLKLSYRARDYWNQFDFGSIHWLPVAKAPMGMYLMDPNELEQSIDQFYRQHPELQRR